MKKLLSSIVLLLSIFSTQAALTWHWVSLPADTNIEAQIVSAMNSAVAEFNTYSDYTGDIPVVYNSGVPTAQTDGFMGTIEFGGSISYRVAMHEMSHWLGTGTYGGWSSFNGGGVWSGAYANNALQSYDGPTATLGCDSQHYWPYGWNYDNEAVYPERHIGMVGALRRDMGLSDMTTGYAEGTYRLRNRVTIKMLDTDGSNTNGSQVKEYSASGSVDQQWVLSLIPGTTNFTLQSVADGKYLDSLGNTTDGSAIGLWDASGSPNQQWHIVATDAGFYQIINVGTGKCLDTGGQDAEGAGLQGWSANPSWNQQWKFVNVTLATVTPGLISQFRPVAASSFTPGLLPENAVDGNSTVTPWTANGGSYPQWWRVDLGAVYNISNVITYWYPGWTFAYRIEVSTNDVDYTTAVDATGNTSVGYTTNNFSAAGRYLRITTTGIAPSGGWASFFDCRVFGTLQTPPAPSGGLLHRYDFTGNANDSVGTANGTLEGSATISGGALNTTAVAGSLSGGVPQNGVLLPAGAVAGITGPFTIESWFKANSAGGYCTLFSFSGNNTASYVLATPARGNSPYASTISVIGGGGENTEQQASEQYQDNGALHQMIVTYDGAALSYYIDGALGSFSNLPPVISNPGLVLATLNYIGINGGSPWNDNSINGSTLDFRIYGQSLTGGQVANLYALGPDASNSTISSSLTNGPTPPNSPTSLSATGGNLIVNLNWTQSTSPGITGNNVYRSTTGVGGPFNLLAQLGATTSYSDTAVQAGATYFYSVTALNSGGESGLSAYSGTATIPAAPSGLTAAPGNSQVSLTWTASSGATSYNVKRSTTSGGPYTTIASGVTTLSYTDTGVANGTTYYYVVSAVNGSGESANSSQVSPTPTATAGLLAYLKFDETGGTTTADSTGDGWPGTLLNGAAFVSGYSNNAVSLASASSQYVTLPGGVVSTLTNFTVAAWVNLASVANWNRIFDFGNNSTVYMFLTPQNGATGNVRYAITTTGGSGEQQINSSSVVPTNGWHHLAVTLSGSIGTLYLDGVAIGTNSAMTLNPASLGVTANNYIGKSEYSDPYLNGKVDEFRIYNGALSAGQVAALAIPTAPTGLKATAQSTHGTIKLSWTQSTSLNITTNNIYRATVSGGPYTKVASVAKTTSYTNSGLTSGTTYYYVVTAVSRTGVEGGYSSQASAKSN